METEEDADQVGRGPYRRDEREGRWAFTCEGRRSAIGSYHRGWREGAWTLYEIFGHGIDARGRYHRGRREGRWIFHHRQDRTDTIIARCRKGAPRGRFVWRQEQPGPDRIVGYEAVVHYGRNSGLEGWWFERYPRGTRPANVERGLYRFGQLVTGDAFDVAEVLWIRDGNSGVRLCEDEPLGFGDLHAFGDRDPPDEDDDGGGGR